MLSLNQKASLALIQKVHNSGFIVLDTETTGLTDMDEIIEVSLVAFNGRVLLDTLVRPVNIIPPEATAIHGITSEMVRDAPTWEEVRGQIGWILVTHPQLHLVIYNADFDTRLLVQTEVTHGGKWFNPSVFDAVCLMELYAQYYGEQCPCDPSDFKWQSLTNACSQMDIDTTQFTAHRALGDCQMTIALMDALNDSGKTVFSRSGA